MKKRSFFLLLAFFTVFYAFAAGAKSAQIRKVWLEHGVTLNSKTAMKVHCDFSVKGMKSLTGHMGIWIKDTNNNWISVDGNATSRTGTKYFKWDYTPGYDDAFYSDYWYAPYVSQLHFSPGKNTYYAVVCIYDNNGEILAQSDPVEFSGTGASNSNRNVNNSVQQQQKVNVKQQTWREELGYGMFAINIGDPNGARSRTIYRACVACRGSVTCNNCYGSGRCPICNGRGGIVSAGYGNYYPCMSCGQSGRCCICKGTGKCACSNYEYPGYMPGSTMVVDARGQIIYNSGSYSGDSSVDTHSSSSSRSNSSSSCYKCHGTGVDPSQSSGGNMSQWVAHYNSSGSKCPYCGGYNEHWHTKCAHCNVP